MKSLGMAHQFNTAEVGTCMSFVLGGIELLVRIPRPRLEKRYGEMNGFI